MSKADELFYPLVPPNIDSMDDIALLRYIAKANSEFGYWAQFHYGINLNYRLSMEEYEQWEAPALRMIHEMDMAISEVFNGGFAQYFTNSSGDDALLAIQGWRKARCEPVAATIEAALLAAFPDGHVPNRDTRIDLIDGNEKHWRAVFDPLETRLYAVVKEMDVMLAERTARYVRENRHEFFRVNPDLPEKFSWMRGKGF
jgi:hypothetical protein